MCQYAKTLEHIFEISNFKIFGKFLKYYITLHLDVVSAAAAELFRPDWSFVMMYVMMFGLTAMLQQWLQRAPTVDG